MNSGDEALGALERVWQAMVMLAEEANDIVVNEQREADATAARHLTEIASDLVALSRAAEVLARLREQS
jgi:hypothetical protein